MLTPSKIAIALLAVGATLAILKFCPCCNKTKLQPSTEPIEEPLPGSTAGPVTISACSSGPFNALFKTDSFVYQGTWSSGSTVTAVSSGIGIATGSFTKYVATTNGPFPVPTTTTTTTETFNFSAGVNWNMSDGNKVPATPPTGTYTSQVNYYNAAGAVVECKKYTWKLS
jgi:hypothetical protein